MKRILITVAVLLPFALTNAQTRTDETTFRIISAKEFNPPLKYDSNDKAVEISSSTGSVSPAYPKPPSGSVLLYQEKAPPAGAPKDSPLVKVAVASFKIPVKYERALVVLIPDSAGASMPYKTLIGDDPKDQPLSTFRVLNLSSHPAAFGLDKEVVQIPANSVKNIPYPQAGKAAFVRLAIRLEGDEEWLLRTEQILHASSRGLCLIHDKEPTETEPEHAAVRLLYEWVRPTP